MSGLSINIGVKKHGLMREIIPPLLDNFAGYFTPHTAAIYFANDANLSYLRREKVVFGGFENWEADGMTAFDLQRRFYPCLPGEQIVDDNWTHTDYPDCSEAMKQTISSLTGQACDLALSGNVQVRAYSRSTGQYVQNVFRQVESWDDSGVLQVSYLPLLWFHAMEGYPHAAPHISINVESDFVLESSVLLMGDVAPMAVENTQLLAKHICQYVVEVREAIDDISFYAIEGRRWTKEANRIWETFQIVPGIEVG